MQATRVNVSLALVVIPKSEKRQPCPDRSPSQSTSRVLLFEIYMMYTPLHRSNFNILANVECSSIFLNTTMLQNVALVRSNSSFFRIDTGGSLLGFRDPQAEYLGFFKIADYMQNYAQNLRNSIIVRTLAKR